MALSWNSFFDFIKRNKIISILIFISFVSSLRTLLLPLFGDEITYSKIAENIIFHGEYSLNNKPSTITPSIPILMAIFYTKFNPVVGFVLAKLANLLFIVIGLRYAFLFFRKLHISSEIVWSLMLLTIVNTNFVLWSLMLYPEALLFCFFWIFIYFLSKTKHKEKDIVFVFLAFMALVLTRYLYAVLGVLIAYMLFGYFKTFILKKNYKKVGRIIILGVLCALPLLFWFNYVFFLEKEVDTGLSYFARFKNNGLLYNLKAGIGLIKHEEVANINGIPAFISLFIPMTGLRNWIISCVLILTFIFGYLVNLKNQKTNMLFIAILLIMAGLVFAGTGFSRYWLVLLPGFLLGFYLCFKKLHLKDSLFVLLAKLVAVIYVLNELRLDYVVLHNL